MVPFLWRPKEGSHLRRPPVGPPEGGGGGGGQTDGGLLSEPSETGPAGSNGQTNGWHVLVSHWRPPLKSLDPGGRHKLGWLRG